MGLLSHSFFFNLFILVSIAYMELPMKYVQDGSKFSFIQAPYISSVRDQKVKEIQEETTNRWPEGIITYYIDDASYDSSVGIRIRSAMSVLEAAACIRFRIENNKPEKNITWIHITNPNKMRQCVHDPKFMDEGEIMLTLGYDCLQQDELLHSLLHGIGFKDEVTHPHRDKYLKVLWENIQPVYRYLYRIQPVEFSRSIVEYDPLSIMHFHDRAFSSNGKATILPLESGLTISPSRSLSQLDKMRLQLYFGHECNKRKFSSLMETCKKSLKDENNQDVEDADPNIEKNDAQDNTGNMEKKSSTEENDQLAKQKGNEKENDASDDNDEFKNMKNNDKEKENTEENIAPVNLKESVDSGQNKDSGVNLNYDTTEQ